MTVFVLECADACLCSLCCAASDTESTLLVQMLGFDLVMLM